MVNRRRSYDAAPEDGRTRYPVLENPTAMKTTAVLSRDHPVKSAPPDIDAEALGHRLARKIKGEVRFDDGSRALYSTDGSNYRQVPIGVIVPRDAEDVM